MLSPQLQPSLHPFVPGSAALSLKRHCRARTAAWTPQLCTSQAA